MSIDRNGRETGRARALQLLLSAALLLPVSASAQVEIADGNVPRASALELAADGSLLVAHGEPGARLLRGDPSAWTSEPLDPHCDDVGALSRHPSGQLIACYHDGLSSVSRVVAAWWTGTDWRFDELDVESGGATCTAGFDADAEPVVAWATSEGVRVARARGGVWDSVLLDDGGGAPVRRDALSFGTAADGHPGLSMRNSDRGAVELARWDGSQWSIETVASGFAPGKTTALAFDPLGSPAVAYRDDSSRDELLATWDGSAWNSEAVRNLAQNVDFRSLRFRDDGTPVLLMGGQLATREATGWQVADLPSEIVPSSGDSLELDASGEAVVLGRTHVALSVGGSWQTWPLDEPWRRVSPQPSLDLGIDGEPRFAHGLLVPRSIASAVRSGGAWTREEVRADVTAPASVSLDHDSLGRPGVAATHEFDTVLSYSSFDGLAWSTEIVDSGPAHEADLSFGPGDLPVIAYRGGVGSLLVASFDGATWNVEEVDGVSRDGAWPSILHDAAGNTVIAYRAREVLNLARRVGGAWSLEVVDGDWPTGRHPRAAFRPDGRLGISHHSDKLDRARLAIETATGWAHQTVELDGFDVARVRDVVFTADGRAVLSQAAWAVNHPQVAWREWESWRAETVDPYVGAWPPELSVAPDGRIVVGYGGGCRGEARVTWWSPPATEFLLIRQSVDSLLSDWRDAAFPFSPSNDDEDAPFPVSARPVSVADELPSGPLVLYRAVVSGGILPPELRVDKVSGEVRITYP